MDKGHRNTVTADRTDAASRTPSYAVDGFAFLGRTLDEYVRFFDLDLDSLRDERVLDCPSGACSFVADASDLGIDAVGVDLAYDESPATLNRRGRRAIAEAMASITNAIDLFTIEGDELGAHREHRTTAHRRFVADYVTTGNRYVHAELPSLPFPDDSFDRVLSAHLLFLYGDRLDCEFHAIALRELSRVAAREVRVFPLVGLDGEPYEHLDEVVDRVRADGHTVERCAVSYEFLRGANEALRVVPGA